MKHSVLFIGNSYTFYNNLPAVVQKLSHDQLLCHRVTKGGAYAHQFADEGHELGILLRDTLATGHWDHVVLQDQSFNPVKDPADCLQAVAILSNLTAGANHYFYQTWAYEDHSIKLQKTNMNYDEMYTKLRQTYHDAAKINHGTVVPVGDAFRHAYKTEESIRLYHEDHSHPSVAGTYLAACVFCGVLLKTDPRQLDDLDGIEPQICAKLRQIAWDALNSKI